MSQLFWVLLIGPPALATITWLMSRGWISAMMNGRSTSNITLWKKYDFWIILAILYVVMFADALLEHKL